MGGKKQPAQSYRVRLTLNPGFRYKGCNNFHAGTGWYSACSEPLTKKQLKEPGVLDGVLASLKDQVLKEIGVS